MSDLTEKLAGRKVIASVSGGKDRRGVVMVSQWEGGITARNRMYEESAEVRRKLFRAEDELAKAQLEIARLQRQVDRLQAALEEKGR